MNSDLQIGRIYLSLSAIMETSAMEGLEQCVVRRSFRANDTVLFNGDGMDYLCYLAKGRVRAEKGSAGGGERTFSYINAGYFICEAVFFAHSVSVGTVVAETACEIWSFSEAYVYNRLFQEHPEIALHIIRSLSMKMVGLYQHVNDLTVHQPRKALAQLLLPWLAEAGVRQSDGHILLKARMTHQQLADLLGLHRVTFTKMLNELSAEGILTKDTKAWHVYDWEYLNQLLDD